MNLMQVLEIDLNCATLTMTWNNNIVHSRPTDNFTEISFSADQNSAFDNPHDEADVIEAVPDTENILHSKYDAADPTRLPNNRNI
jgi:hypothetical protein